MIRLVSFSYRAGVPAADAVIDCRVLRNPHHDSALRMLDGRDARVRQFVERDPRFHDVVDEALLHAKLGRTIAFGCFGGRHRSVAVASCVAVQLERAGQTVELVHRELQSSQTTSQV